MRPCYYNDSDPFVCAWLRNLIAAGLIPAGEVDERPIQEVTPDDVRGFAQCHFFAGIGGWAYALQLASWPDDRPVWTGSCPCQPFSAAGARQSHADARHLWPAWFHLVRECRPVTVFGEQVGDAVGLGWWDAVATDLESEAYTVGACVLGAHSVGAPHRRQRLWFVAHHDGGGFSRTRLAEQERQASADSRGNGAALAHAPLERSEPGRRDEQPEARAAGWDVGQWAIEPDVGRVAHGIPNGMGSLCGFGNAIVPQVAAAFVSAYVECVRARTP